MLSSGFPLVHTELSEVAPWPGLCQSDSLPSATQALGLYMTPRVYTPLSFVLQSCTEMNQKYHTECGVMEALVYDGLNTLNYYIQLRENGNEKKLMMRRGEE